MAHAQTRVAAFHDVLGRPAKAEHEEVTQALLGAGHVLGGIHWPEDVVAWDLLVECADEALETVVANAVVEGNFHLPIMTERWRVGAASSVAVVPLVRKFPFPWRRGQSPVPFVGDYIDRVRYPAQPLESWGIVAHWEQARPGFELGMSDILFSIIVPVYNGAPFLDPLIESALSQTYDRFELIFVDDCSPDDSAAVIQRYEDPRIRYIAHETNGGAAAARETGTRPHAETWSPAWIRTTCCIRRSWPLISRYGGSIPIRISATTRDSR